MGVRNKSSRSHYFVPLGRERGGYLDFLGLPPDASVGDVGRKQTEYLKRLETTFKERRKEMRKALEENTISPQEFEAKIEQLKDERTKNEQRLNELRARFDTVQAEKRGARSTNRQEDASWLEMYRCFSGDLQEFWSFLLRPRPLPNVPHELLLEIEQRWINPHVKGQHNDAPPALSRLASQSCPKNKPVDLTTLAALVTERDLICLLAADALWNCIRYTNRKHWQNVIEQWVSEIAALGPRLLHEAKGPASADYPALHKPTKLMIEQLEVEEVGEISQSPQRGAGQRESELAMLLEKFLAQEQGTTYGDSETDNATERLLDGPQLDELLALLNQTNQAEMD